MATTQSRRDLNKKLRLEGSLRPKLRRLNARIVSKYRAGLRKNGTIININEFTEDLEQMLDQHYRLTGKAFQNNLGPRLPKDVAKTATEKAEIATALAAWYLLTIPESARRINGTTRENMTDSLAEAEQDELVRTLTGREARLTAAVIAAAALDRKLRGRENTILMSETQNVAEVAKATEAEILSGLSPHVSGASNAQVEVTKEWVTVGDSKVRVPHVVSDGQTVPLNKPFEVGGELLRQPRDSSLGASAVNIINCRCSSEPNRTEIVNLRRTEAELLAISAPGLRL